MRIAMVGTRGVPARYGGFETAVEEIGSRLAQMGHDVTVYCRSSDESTATYRGMRCIVLPAVRHKSLETLSHTFLSSLDALRRPRFDAVFLFNAANVPFVPILRRRRTRVAVHVDGLELRRSKWGRAGQRYYKAAEALSARWADALIADASAIGTYYADEFRATTEMIPYGAPILRDLDARGLDELGVESGKFHLVVARFEPENHVELIVRGYRHSDAVWPLVVVGGAPYAHGYVAVVNELAAGDPRIRLVGPVWDQELLDRLYFHCGTYLHGHSVGGTNPSLLRAMGAGAAVNAYDVVFAREVLGDTGSYFRDEASLAALLHEAESDPEGARARGRRGRDRVDTNYRWDEVARDYERLAERLSAGASRRREVSGRRNKNSPWNDSSGVRIGEPDLDPVDVRTREAPTSDNGWSKQ